MNPRNLVTRAVERALERNAPIQSAMSGAAHALDLSGWDLELAQSEAARGRVDLALAALGSFGPSMPLIAQAAALDPQAAGVASRAVRTIPSAQSLILPACCGMTYLLALAMLQAGCVLLLRYKIFPVFVHMHAGMPVLLASDLAPYVSSLFSWGLPLLAAAIVVSLSTGGRFFFPRIRRDLQLAHVYAVAAALAEPARAPELVGRFLEKRKVAFVAHGEHAAREYWELSRAYAASAEARALRATTRVKVVGASIFVLLTLVVASGIYLTIPLLPVVVQ